MDTSNRLSTLRAELSSFSLLNKYYAGTLSDEDGRICHSFQTHFVRYSDRNPRWEIRAPSIVYPDRMAGAWDIIGQGWIAVHNQFHFAVWIRAGGNALIEKGFAEAHVPWLRFDLESVHDGPSEQGGFGFRATNDLPDEAATRRHPRSKLRMRVLKRDGFRCVICRRRDGDYPDMELHVHHVIPWQHGGPTTEENLVTLCAACHRGLDPEYQPVLRGLAGLPGPTDPRDLDSTGAHFRRSVQRYRVRISKAAQAADATEDRP